MRQARSIAERFWEKVDKNGPTVNGMEEIWGVPARIGA